ncbi:TetR/AcrR family transcriptional regulator [Inquilinus sp. KBS0705]|nr:TetR/AcrR family transcriptional regulator [Inquilinus sp. KBS0705]
MRTRDNGKEELVKQQAIQMIVKDGLEGFSMNKLARACKISVATLYIYYKDRDDLIIKIALEEGKHMCDAMIKGFDPEAPFEDGMRIQWKNRYAFMAANPLLGMFFEQLQSSTYHMQFLDAFTEFKLVLHQFMSNVIKRGEIEPMPLEVYWSVAFAPLYSLVRFDNQGRSVGGKPFKMTDEVLWKTFDLVIKALKK